MQSDLARTTFEFLQNVRTSAESQCEWASGLASGHLECLLDEEPTGGSRRRGLSYHRAKSSHDVTVAVNAHAAPREVNHQMPPRHKSASALSSDPTGQAVRTTRKHDLQPPHAATIRRLSDLGQDGLLASDRSTGSYERNLRGSGIGVPVRMVCCEKNRELLSRLYTSSDTGGAGRRAGYST